MIEAPVRIVWELLGDPNRHPDWWPTTVEAECDEIEQGCRYRGVVKNPRGKLEEHEFTLERLDDCHEVLIRCHGVGTYTRFLLTEARGSTFVDAQFGIDPQSVGVHVMTVVAGRRILRLWLRETLDSLEQAAVSRARAASDLQA